MTGNLDEIVALLQHIGNRLDCLKNEKSSDADYDRIRIAKLKVIDAWRLCDTVRANNLDK